MANLPLPIEQREELDCRLGIKSSLSEIASIVGLCYALYCANEKKSEIIYAEEVLSVNGKKKLSLKRNFLDWICANYSVHENIVNANPLLTSQLEALQVGLSLMFRLAKITYVDFPNTDTKERTGGERYRKQLCFATNMRLVDVYLSAWSDNDVKQEISHWIQNTPTDSEVSKGLKQMLTTFSEDTQFKIRSQEREVIFQQDGIYRSISLQNNVVAKDEQEDVGPFRVFKSYVREGLHPYLSMSHNEFSCEDTEDFRNYQRMVETALQLSPKKVYVFTEIPTENKQYAKNDNLPRQIIYYGAPGTGKSNRIDELTDEGNRIRTTFHPDSDYSTFVGAYKPTMKRLPRYNPNSGLQMSEEEKIAYQFVPQAFLKAYVEAWRRKSEGNEEPFYLVIEEINRGNCAQIFGDLFQLLDRDTDGQSKYAICPDDDIQRYLGEAFKGCENLDEEIKNGTKMILPANLYIWATMNTSDQSLFPIDSAFKRRWDWEYMPIEDAGKGHVIVIGTKRYDWWTFISQINDKIGRITNSEDKKLGYWFVIPQNGGTVITAKQFVSKVLFYLWNDVYKDYAESSESIFKTTEENGTVVDAPFTSFFGKDAEQRLQGFMEYNGIETLDEIEEDDDEEKVIDGIHRRQHLRVVFDDSTTIEENNSTITFINVLKKIGLAKIEELELTSINVPIVSTEQLDTYSKDQKLVDNYWIYTKQPTAAKKKTLEEISALLDLRLEVSIVEAQEPR